MYIYWVLMTIQWGIRKYGLVPYKFDTMNSVDEILIRQQRNHPLLCTSALIFRTLTTHLKQCLWFSSKHICVINLWFENFVNLWLSLTKIILYIRKETETDGVMLNNAICVYFITEEFDKMTSPITWKA